VLPGCPAAAHSQRRVLHGASPSPGGSAERAGAAENTGAAQARSTQVSSHCAATAAASAAATRCCHCTAAKVLSRAQPLNRLPSIRSLHNFLSASTSPTPPSLLLASPTTKQRVLPLVSRGFLAAAAEAEGLWRRVQLNLLTLSAERVPCLVRWLAAHAGTILRQASCQGRGRGRGYESIALGVSTVQPWRSDGRQLSIGWPGSSAWLSWVQAWLYCTFSFHDHLLWLCRASWPCLAVPCLAPPAAYSLQPAVPSHVPNTSPPLHHTTPMLTFPC